MKKAPHWPLDSVKSIAEGKSGILLKRTRALAFFHKPEVAYSTTRAVIADLSVDDFSESLQQQFGEWMDVYGIVLNDAGWMLKFTIDESQPQIVVVSFHPLEKGPLRTNKGMVKP